MTYLRCTNVVDLDDTPLGELIDRAEQGCEQCGEPVLGIFVGRPRDAAALSEADVAVQPSTSRQSGDGA